MSLVTAVYGETAGFPKQELFGLTSQTRRAAVSVPSNIAEGAGRNSSAELTHFISVACGSLAELETQLQIAVDLGCLRPDSRAIRQLDKAGIFVRRLRKTLVETLKHR